MTREVALTLTTSAGYDDHLDDDEISIVEISCIELSDRRPTGRRYHRYVSPPAFLSESAIAETGFTNEFLDGQPTFEEITDEVLSFIGHSDIVVYVKEFERKHFLIELSRAGKRQLFKGKFIDVHMMAGELTNSPPNDFSISEICKRMGIAQPNDHDPFDFLEKQSKFTKNALRYWLRQIHRRPRHKAPAQSLSSTKPV